MKRIHTLAKGIHLAPLYLRIPRNPAPHHRDVVGPYTLLPWNLKMSGEAARGRR